MFKQLQVQEAHRLNSNTFTNPYHSQTIIKTLGQKRKSLFALDQALLPSLLLGLYILTQIIETGHRMPVREFGSGVLLGM